MNLSKLWKIVKDREAWRAAVHRVSKSQTWLSDWTTTTKGQEEKSKEKLLREVHRERLEIRSEFRFRDHSSAKNDSDFLGKI